VDWPNGKENAEWLESVRRCLMKLGDVLKKERVRKKFTVEDICRRLGLAEEEYGQMENGDSPAEEWGPRLALIAIALQTPTARLIADTGKSAQSNQTNGQCGMLIRSHRERRGLTRDQLAEKLGLSPSEIEEIEAGNTPLEFYLPLLLTFAESIEQPIFNLFYPCGLPLNKLTDYP
jgi:transcriptional regulator with XRE-family HTH domain